MPKSPKADLTAPFVRQWTLPAASTLGSSVRAKGILLEVRARLAPARKKALDLSGRDLILRMPEGSEPEFLAIAAFLSGILEGIENLPILPREIEDILSISTTERHRWVKDNRLPSAGTRTIKLRGRARQITFHVFDPRRVEEVLNEDLVSAWREDDALAKAERRRQAVWKARLSRAQKQTPKGEATKEGDPESSIRHELAGWAEFEREGLLR